MKIRGQFSVAALTGLLCLGSTAQSRLFAQAYLVTDLGTPNNGGYSDPHGLNATGAVVGEWEPTNSAFQKGFVYRNGTSSDVGSLGAFATTIAYGVNGAGVVVGESTPLASFTPHAFFYTNGAMSDLGTLGGSYSSAQAVNGSGQVVGLSSTVAGPMSPDHAIWYHGGTKTDLGVIGGNYSAAFGINDAGVIVGESDTVSAGVTNLHAFIYTNGTMSDLSTLGGNYSSARAINSAGQIVGESAVAGGDIHAFLRTGGTLTDLGTFGGTYSTAAAVNSAGHVVGYSLTVTGEALGFLYDGSQMVDLNPLMAPGVCTNLISADGINDSGQITGSGYTPNGDYHAFLLIPVALWLSGPMWTNGQFRATVQGTPGEHFAFLASTDLVHWIGLATNTLVTNAFECVDPAAGTNPNRFYRAQLLP